MEREEMPEARNCEHQPSRPAPMFMLSGLEPDTPASKTADLSHLTHPTHPQNPKAAGPTESQTSEHPKPTARYAPSISSVTADTHLTSAPPTQARTDGSLPSPDRSWDQASDIPVDHEASSGRNDSTRENADENIENLYRDIPLGKPGSIRLLRLLPHEDENAGIQCQLFEYSLQGLGEGAHLYEALSYVWGSSSSHRNVSVNGHDIRVTANLHAALLHLRDRCFERIIWVDAICINQAHDGDKGEQIQYMAEIYSKASRVVVWLGEAENDGDQALEDIGLLADDMFGEPMVHEPSKQAILALLQRPWFQRVWVLQEVAAARSILMKCGSTEIDGYAFCVALDSRLPGLLGEAPSDLRGLIRSVTYLIRGAVFRRKKVSRSTGRFSLRIRPLGELIDMYHTHKATKRHDKVFALLGMSSDDPGAAGILPNYKIPWREFLHQLIKFLLGGEVSVKTWAEAEMAVIESKGLVLGKVSSEGKTNSNNRQRVLITPKDASGHLGPKTPSTLHPSAKSIQAGDLVCLLLGASKPTIIRPCKDYFSVVVIAAPLEGITTEDGERHDLILVWDWKTLHRDLHDREYETVLRSREAWHPGREGHLDKLSRLWNTALILKDAEEYKKAEVRLREVVEGYEREFGEEDLRTLSGKDKLALAYKNMKQWEEAKRLFQQVIQTRKHVLGADHPDTTSSMVMLLSVYRDQGDIFQAEKFEAMRNILEQRRDARITEEVVEIAKSCNEEEMRILLDWKRDEVQITEGVGIAAAGNEKNGNEVISLLLARRGDEVQITEGVVKAAAGNKWQGAKIIRLLLDRRGDEVQITEGVITAAAGNEGNGYEVIWLLLDRKGDEVRIT
ncbi:hypothetical protein DL770_009681 [Monosporascus sp. CRB-9-2]|nr:hypothetical protein DL770_009681 [Monosporascus sp. CRB-9-2]